MDDIAAVRDRARFVPPMVVPQAIPRSRLDGIYSQSTGRVLRVIAPGGYGKSTQVARWVAGDEREVRWVDLERVDNDPISFLWTLTRSLDGLVDLPSSRLANVVLDDETFVTTMMPDFAEAIRLSDVPFVLVLDDMHHLDGLASSSLADAIAKNLPPTSTLILSGRSQMRDASVARLRLRPGVLDVTVKDLAFDVAETWELASTMGLDLELDDVNGLAERFEGWPAGLRLAVHAHRSGKPPPPELSEADSLAVVVDYLRAEWTANLGDADRTFLREIAGLERFTGAMCDEILGRRGSAARLRRLHRHELVLLPLDQRDAWFRMHPVLARWLESELKDDDKDRWREIHVSAAGYWEGEGDVDLAVRHAARAGDTGLCETLVSSHGPAYFSRGLHSTVRHWLDNFPSEFVRSSAALCCMNAWQAMHAGDGAAAKQWCAWLYRATDRRSGPDHDAWAPLVDIVHATLDTRPAAQLLPGAEQSCRTLTGGPWHVLGRFAVGGLRFVSGLDGALEALAEGGFEAQLAGASLQEAQCLAASSLILDLDGDHDRAGEAGRRAQSVVRAEQCDAVPTIALVTAMNAVIEARAGNRQAAAADLALSRGHLVGFGTVTPWFNVMVRCALVRASLLLGDRAASAALSAELEHHLGLATGEGPRNPVFESLRSTVAAAQRIGREASTLTSAELNVLQHLPSNLTLAEIADLLFVSRNTVKSHAAAIYRKLGTASRREAVQLARRAGLIDSFGTGAAEYE